jgi:conjugative relaxase-like TrwC/TraI family protein
MISCHAISSGGGAAAYFEKSFTKDGNLGADNYYSDEKAQAVWRGQGAQILGLAGEKVEREAFVKMLDGKLYNPVSQSVQDLTLGGKIERRAGADFTVAAPKSISIMALAGGDDRLVQAHKESANAAMVWLEKHASTIRVKDEMGQNTVVQTGNLIWAEVQHETNRSNEPHLHTHNVIAYASFDAEKGDWRSLTNDRLLQLRANADVIYKATLAERVQAIGYEVEWGRSGVDFEIKEISKGLMTEFSSPSVKRSEQLESWGIAPSEASWSQRQAAVLSTRDQKNELERGELGQIWGDTVKGMGVNLTQVKVNAELRAAQIEQNGGLTQGTDGSALRVAMLAVQHLAEREQSFPLLDVQVEALKMNQGQFTVADLNQAIDHLGKTGELVDKGFNEKGVQIVTTQSGIATELEVRSLLDAKREGSPVVLTSEAEFDGLLKNFEAKKSEVLGFDFELSAEQRVAAQNVLMNAEGYQGIQGSAGTGKTTALEFVKEVAQEKGWEVQGIALTSSAAEELARSTGVPTLTVAGFMHHKELEQGRIANEIKEIKQQLALETKRSSEQGNGGPGTRVKFGEFDAHFARVEFGSNTYSIDTQRGEVFKTPTGLVNQLGTALYEHAKVRQVKAEGWPNENWFSTAKEYVNEKVGSVGLYLMGQEKVDLIEKIAVEAKYYELNPAAGKLGLEEKIKTLQAQIANLEKTGNVEGKKTLLMLDEAGLAGVKDMAVMMRMANAQMNARFVVQGDRHQLGSVTAGRAFEQMQDYGMHVSTLKETRRFDNALPQTKEAVSLWEAGKHREAYERLDRFEVAGAGLAQATADRYVHNLKELEKKDIKAPDVGVVTMTNIDRKAINAAVHEALRAEGRVGSAEFAKKHLDDPKLTPAQKTQVAVMRAKRVDTLVFRETNKKLQVKYGEEVKVTSYNLDTGVLKLKTGQGREIALDPMKTGKFDAYVTEERIYSVGDKIEARANLTVGSGAEAVKIKNGKRGVVAAMNAKSATIEWADGLKTTLTNDQVKYVDLAYARTTMREQSATKHVEINAVSATGAKVVNVLGAYVNITRAKINTELVIHNESVQTFMKNVSKGSAKTTAIEEEKGIDRSEGGQGKVAEWKVPDNANPKMQAAHEQAQRGYFAQGFEALDRMEVKPWELKDAVGQQFMRAMDAQRRTGHGIESVQVVAFSAVDVKRANEGVQNALVMRGEINPEAHVVQHLERVSLDSRSMQAANFEAKGVNYLVAMKDHPELSWEKGDALRITGFDAKENQVNVITPYGEEMTLKMGEQAKGLVAHKLVDKTLHEQDRVIVQNPMRLLGQELAELRVGTKATVTGFDENGANIKTDAGVDVHLTKAQMRNLDLAYAQNAHRLASSGEKFNEIVIATSSGGAKALDRNQAREALQIAGSATIVTSDFKGMQMGVEKDRVDQALVLSHRAHTEKANEKVTELAKNASQNLAQSRDADIATTKDQGFELGR